MEWRYDYGLLGRMVLLLALLGVLGLAAAAATAAVVGYVLAFFPLVLRPEATLPTTAGAVVVVGITLAILGAVVYGERHAPEHTVASLGAVPADSSERPVLHDSLQRLAQQADLPVPSVYVAPTAAPLALTTGYSAEDARLVLGAGLLERLDRSELEAVLAHELAHVKNRDAAVMTAATVPLGAAERTLDLVRGGTSGVHHGVTSRADYPDAVLTAALLLSAPVGVCAYLLAASLSRAREVAADRGAVAITGEPAALASALERLDGSGTPTADLRRTSVSVLSITDTGSRPYAELFGSDSLLARSLATHPPTDRRVRALREQI